MNNQEVIRIKPLEDKNYIKLRSSQRPSSIKSKKPSARVNIHKEQIIVNNEESKVGAQESVLREKA